MSTALILHPDWRARDPYGVISRALVRQVHDRVAVYRDGWNDCAEQRRQKDRISYVPMQYVDIRDTVMRMVDLPYELVCQIALNISPWIDNRTPYWPRDGWVSWEEMSFYPYTPIL